MTKGTTQSLALSESLAIQDLIGLAAELEFLRDYPPLVKKSDGKYEGDILGFVKGLRLSACLIYHLRKQLSSTQLEVNWGHILDESGQSCSPECDIIIHEKGHVARWNGNANPVMEFVFVKASSVRGVVSCKSQLASIDKKYPLALKKFGVNHIFLFAENCPSTRLQSLDNMARKAGYKGLWCLYTTGKGGIRETNDRKLVEFRSEILKSFP